MQARAEHIVTSVAPRIRRLARAIAREKRADADDLYQTAMEASIKHARGWRPDEGMTLYAYVYRVARAAVLEACNREKAWATLIGGRGRSVIDEQLDAIAASDDNHDPEHELERGRARDAVHAAMGRLSQIERQLVWIYAVEERSRAEAARILGLDYERARTVYDGAMKKLRRDVKRAAISRGVAAR